MRERLQETVNAEGYQWPSFTFSSEFTHLKSLVLECTKSLTAAKFNAIPLEAKASIETLHLHDVDTTGFDFLEFTNLKNS